MKKILVTGGCGFIGSNFIKFILDNTDFYVINVDKHTYAGKGSNLKHMRVEDSLRYKFYLSDVASEPIMNRIFEVEKPNYVVNFAAESHVDNSIEGPLIFTKSNVLGTHVLLEAARKLNVERFLHISTDEVYGSLGKDSPSSLEHHKLDPRSPYSASKTSAEHITKAYFETYKLPIIITRSSNNYGPYQFPEKLVPKFITNLIDGKRVPLMWSDDNPGMNVRDWLHVEDNCRAIHLILTNGQIGETYNIAGDNEYTNLEVTKTMLSDLGLGEEMIERVPHRKGHDFRYSIDCSKLKQLGFEHKYKDFKQGLKQTIQWYRENESWWRALKND
tara:strand:+ start:2933 stop:3925 length:993 start_codon:yes stop_codon:yes gene_type:complete